jgi:arabinofuranan 3-O-arabinosyltransferase
MQSAAEQREADARLQPFDSLAGVRMAVGGTIVSLAYIGMVLTGAYILTTQMGMTSMSVDFRVFWGAAKLALAGEPLAAHDLARLGAAHGTFPDAYFPWLYPPSLLLLITPLGALSFFAAFLVWTVLSYAAIAIAIRPFVASIRTVWVLCVFSPACLACMMNGQTSILWMAGLVGALAALRAERWILAGVLIGCLTLKPQLGLMIPFALLACGAWLTILAASVTTLILIVVPTLIYGVEYWSLLQAGLAEHSDRMLSSFSTIKFMVSPLYTFSFYGVPADYALTIQWGITAILPIVVVLIWRLKTVSFDIKAAVLVMAILLSAPYLWLYEAALMMALALFLVRGGVLDMRPAHLAMIFLLWIGCGLQAVNHFVGLVRPQLLGAAYIAPLLFWCLWLCAHKVFANQQPTPANG